MIKQFAFSMLRHALTAGGAILVARGLTDASGADQLVGAGSVVAGVVWSFLEKRYVFLKA